MLVSIGRRCSQGNGLGQANSDNARRLAAFPNAGVQGTARMRILVVDDHEVVRRGICSVLAPESAFTVCGEAVDGRDAVEKARSLRPDVVVMDITMPNMNGLAAACEIKSFLPNINIVIVSQHETPEMFRRAFSSGASAYVAKSSIATELLTALKKLHNSDLPAAGGTIADINPTLELSPGSSAIERAFRESEARLRSVMNNMAEGLYTLDSEGLVTYLNRSAESMFGWSLAELLGRKMHDMTHHTHPDGTPFPASECPGLQVVQKGIELREHEDVFIRKDGSFFPVVLSSSPLKTDGKISGVVVCFCDDTKRRNAEQNLRDREHSLQVFVQTLEARILERTEELQKATQQLRELSGKLLRIQDEERRHIARELHDGVGQLLVAMSMNMFKVGLQKENLSADSRQFLEESINLLQQASQEIRTMSHLLHPPLLDEVGLASALRWYVDGFSERSSISVQLDLAAGFSEGLPRDLALSLFRIVQECLTNVHRHSESSTAFVSIRRSSTEIRLEVKDVGRGIPAELQSRIFSGECPGVGLRGMRERIRQFDGRFDMRSENGTTTIAAALPIRELLMPEKEVLAAKPVMLAPIAPSAESVTRKPLSR
jgi:PAS domain S-box-containing protein